MLPIKNTYEFTFDKTSNMMTIYSMPITYTKELDSVRQFLINDVDVLVDLDILPIKSSLGLRNELIFFSVFSDYLLRDRFEEFFSFRKDAEMLLFGGLLGRGIEMFWIVLWISIDSRQLYGIDLSLCLMRAQFIPIMTFSTRI